VVPTTPTTDGPDNEPRITTLKRKYTLEELYEMRQILLVTLPTLSTEDAEGMIVCRSRRLQTCLLNGTTLEELRGVLQTLYGALQGSLMPPPKDDLPYRRSLPHDNERGPVGRVRLVGCALVDQRKH